MSATLYMMKGLPASGKSTRAKNMLKEFGYGNAKICNKDQLRAMLDDGHWSGLNEKFLLHVRDYIITQALKEGKHAIVDDTNLAPKHIERLQQLARENAASFEIIDFTHVPLDECLERDRQRQNYVGEKVIRDMHNKFLRHAALEVQHDPALRDCVIIDLDGTLCYMSGRGPFEWDKVDTDTPNKSVLRLIDLIAPDMTIFFVSGRDECCRTKCENWLRIQSVVTYDGLFMRPAGDMRDDRIIKREIYEREIRGKYNVLWVMDDRNKVVDQWRELGLQCWQVAPGDF